MRKDNGRGWGFTLLKNTGTLALVKYGGVTTVAYVADYPGDAWEAPLEDVLYVGAAPTVLGLASVAERGMRIDAAGRPILVFFTGERVPSDPALGDLQMSRLSGDLDPLEVFKAGRVLWQNRGFWRDSKDARVAWQALLQERPTPTRRQYSQDFRDQALRLVQEGHSVAAAAKAVGVSPSTLRRWLGKAADTVAPRR